MTTPNPQATVNSVVSTAMSFVGKVWSENGCWSLCNNIASAVGAPLPSTSYSFGAPGVANSGWLVAYNGPAGQQGDWQSMVKAGEIVSFATSATSGHITTCVAGSGASAQLVDNIAYINPDGTIANSAHDGIATDIVIAPPHLASQEFAQARPNSIVIYELRSDTSAPSAGAPILSAQTADQVWRARQQVSFHLPTGTFRDPQGSALTYSATQVKGRQLGVTFNPSDQTFSGTTCSRQAKGVFHVTATNTAGLSTSENFTVKIANSAGQFAHAISAFSSVGGPTPTSLHEIVASHPHMLALPVGRV